MFQEYLHELENICSTKVVLPKSCTVPDSLLDVGLLSASGYVYEGTLGGSKVRIQRVRIHPERDHQKVQVCPDVPMRCFLVPKH